MTENCVFYVLFDSHVAFKRQLNNFARMSVARFHEQSRKIGNKELPGRRGVQVNIWAREMYYDVG